MATVGQLSPAGRPSQVDGEEVRYEVVDGQYVESPPMGAYQNVVASHLAVLLGGYARQNRLGRVVIETLFVLDPASNLRRRPDVAFVSYSRWPEDRPIPDDEAWEVVPNLAIEVISPSNKSTADNQKLQDYFQAGVERVWVIYTATKQIYVYDSPTKICVLRAADEIDGAPLLPGFRMPIATFLEVVKKGE